MQGLYFIPTPTQLTSMEAFRDAVVNHEGLQLYYFDDLSEIYKNDPEEWHNAFMHYHDLVMDGEEVAIGLCSNGFWIDDLCFVIINDSLPLRLSHQKLK